MMPGSGLWCAFLYTAALPQFSGRNQPKAVLATFVPMIFDRGIGRTVPGLVVEAYKALRIALRGFVSGFVADSSAQLFSDDDLVS
jgi:hypothetical protein